MQTTTSAIGMMVGYYPGSAEGLDGRVLPALVTGVDLGPPDFGHNLTVFKCDGTSVHRWRPASAAGWSAGGANPAVGHWDFIAEAGR
jgi:hypothetical protein